LSASIEELPFISRFFAPFSRALIFMSQEGPGPFAEQSFFHNKVERNAKEKSQVSPPKVPTYTLEI
jgi:hypothetical protein